MAQEKVPNPFTSHELHFGKQRNAPQDPYCTGGQEHRLEDHIELILQQKHIQAYGFKHGKGYKKVIVGWDGTGEFLVAMEGD